MDLAQRLNVVKNRIGLVSGSLAIQEYDGMDEDVASFIDTVRWNITIRVRKGYEPVSDRRQKAYAKKKGIDDAKAVLLEDLLSHELAHWELPFGSGRGCPYDAYNHDLILEAVKSALPHEKQSRASYVANAFEDLLINPRCKEYKGRFPGMVLFFDAQGMAEAEWRHDNGGSGRGTQQQYPPFYEAFVRLNMHLWGDKADEMLLKRHYSRSSAVAEAVSTTIRILKLEKGIKDTSPLFERDKWPEMARAFAKTLAGLLEEEKAPRLSSYTPGDGEGAAGNGIEQRMGGRDGKEEVASGRYRSNKPLSPNMTPQDQLDALYSALARAIPINVEAMSVRQDLVIGPLNFRPLDPDTDDYRRAKPRLYATEEGLTLGFQRTPLTVSQRAKVQVRSFPDFKVLVLDNSRSMQYEPGYTGTYDEPPVNVGSTAFIPWGDKSRYHYALLGMYGAERYLQEQGIAQYIRHGLMMFSASTRYEECGFAELQGLRQLALSPEFGKTEMDVSVLLAALREKESFVMSISDGEIQGLYEQKKEFLGLAARNYFVHIQVGRQNALTREMEEKGLKVFYVNSGEELSNLMLTATRATYGQFVQR